MRTFQRAVGDWVEKCFGHSRTDEPPIRANRFFEEAAELVQAAGMTRGEAHQLVDYVFDRPVGETFQEVGGVMITLAAFCEAFGIDLHDASRTELERVVKKIEAIRAKSAAKPKRGPLAEEAKNLSMLDEAMKIILPISQKGVCYDLLPAEVEKAKALTHRLGLN